MMYAHTWVDSVCTVHDVHALQIWRYKGSSSTMVLVQAGHVLE